MTPLEHEDILASLQQTLGTESLFRTLSNFDAVASLGTGTIIFDSDRNADDELSRDLQAVALARTLGLQSIDRARKRFPEVEGVGDPGRTAYVRAYLDAMAHINQCRAALKTNPDAELTLGMYAGSVAMERLVHTMFSAHLLYQLRLRIEADAVARLALEQIAWSVAVAGCNSRDEIDLKQPQRSISALKRLVENPHPGRLYSYLSGAAHAGIARHHTIFDVDDKGRGVIRHGVTDWAGSAQIMMMLADLWVIAYESVQRSHLSRTVSTVSEAPFGADPQRPFLAEIERVTDMVRNLEAGGD
ncbi:hypothetical protein [Microbacterium sp. 67-17]|uniref:hypothetical protein n=1 Tax=Microbacterium sp. 67-17 TaxID=1895782 RepID=UPI000AAA0811|nr:hypothetical protein [Microbacterium sp. 67-17]